LFTCSFQDLAGQWHTQTNALGSGFFAVNSAGNAVGYSTVYPTNLCSSVQPHAWAPSNGGDLNPSDASGSEAFGINDNNIIAGTAWPHIGPARALIWNAAGLVSYLPDFGKGSGIAGLNRVINNKNYVVGAVTTADGSRLGVVWKPDGTVINLGPYAQPYAINENNLVVGALSGPPYFRPTPAVWDLGNSGVYVALGDSYSSGEGNPPFLAGTDGAGDFCHRSSQAYPEVLGAQIGTSPLFYACSGAKTSDITSTSLYGEDPQITRKGVDPSAALVTMTIGGNDANFSNVLAACIAQKLKATINNVGPVCRWLGLSCQDPSCSHSSTFVASVNMGIDNVFWPVKRTEQRLLTTVDPQNTSVVVADYPHLFSASSAQQGCLSLVLTGDDQTFMNGASDRLDGVLQQAAGEAGVNFVDVRGAFAGHEICSSNGSYLNAITWPIKGSFHPNAAGHAYGYAAAVASYIKSAANLTSSGFPVNPTALPDPPSTPVIPPVGVGTLTAQPVTTGSADCEDTYQAGQEVQLSGGGFTPGANVQLFVSSAGHGELAVGSTTASGTGQIAAVVRIPLSATGFTQPDASAGLVFVDAIGTGSAADHLDDIAMAGLAPHSSNCGTVEPLPFDGFTPPVANPPEVNTANPGRAVPVKFSIPGSNGTLASVFAAGYPQSAPVSCTTPETPTSGDPTDSVGSESPTPGDKYNYVWKTDRGWRGCRALIVKLVDGTYHRALFDFGR
jgi:hypothetical protein